MKRIYATLLLIFGISMSSIFAQDITIKKDVVSVDGVEICVLSDDPSVRGSFYVDDLTGSHLIYFKWIFIGDYNYYEIYDADNLDRLLCEEANAIGFKKVMLKKLYNAEVISSEGLDEKALERHAASVGKEFTRIREEKSRN